MRLKEILNSLDTLEVLGGYRLHLAKKSGGGACPLDALKRIDESDEWMGWNSSMCGRNRFPGEFVVSFARAVDNQFIFGGIWRINERSRDGYGIELTALHNDLIGNLAVEYQGKLGMATVVREEKADKIFVRSLEI